jgi:prepilin-type N-terminal cleavage/methylation domain-containing protein
MVLSILKQARGASRRGQGGFTLVELLVVIAILGALAAIVLFNIAGVNATAACNAMKTDGSTIQGAVDLYYYTNNVYPDKAGDTATPATGDVVDTGKLVTANFLHMQPPAGEVFTYKAAASKGTVTGTLAGCAAYTP